jgi:hypothetical protein
MPRTLTDAESRRLAAAYLAMGEACTYCDDGKLDNGVLGEDDLGSSPCPVCSGGEA